MLGTDKRSRLTPEQAQNYQEVVFPQGARLLGQENKSGGWRGEQVRQNDSGSSTGASKKSFGRSTEGHENKWVCWDVLEGQKESESS